MREINSLSWWHVIVFLTVVILSMWIARRANSRRMTAFVCVIMICVSGLRHGYVDTRAYRTGFEYLNVDKVLNWDFLMNSESKDKGFSVLSAIIKIFTENSQMFLFILAILTVGCLFWGIVNRVHQIDLGIFLFITTGCFLDTMNGARQALVGAILFWLLPRFIEEKKFFKYIVLVLLLSTIHSSALLFIPLYFIASQKAWSGYTYGLIVVCLGFYVLYNSGVGAFLVDVLEGTSYGDDYGEMLLMGNTSVNIVRIFVAAVPVVMAFVTRGYKEKHNVSYNIAFNMSVINLMVWIFASKVLYFYRLAAYFAPYMILLLCYEIDFIHNKRNKQLITYAALMCYLIYHIYSLHVMGDTFFVGYMKY